MEAPAVVDLGQLFDYGESAIVTLVVGGVQMVAHRTVLAASSPEFRAMLADGGAEVAVPGVEVAVLRQVLCYVYSQQAPRLPDLAPQLLPAAVKFGLPGLRALCEEHLATELTVETAAATAVLAFQQSCDGLLRAALVFLEGNLFAVMSTPGWRDALLNSPQAVAEVTQQLSELRAGTREEPAVERGPAAGPEGSALAVSGRRVPKYWELVQAAEEGSLEEVRALLVAGADVRERERSSWTPLHWAADRGHVAMLRCLLEAGAAADARSDIRETPLHVAARAGHKDVAQVLLLEADANIYAKDVHGQTPIHRAVLCGHWELAMTLLQLHEKYAPSGMTWWTWSW